METIVNILTICTCSFLYYNAGRYNTYAKIYEKALKDYICMHLEENFQDDVKNKIKEKQNDTRRNNTARRTCRA